MKNKNIQIDLRKLSPDELSDFMKNFLALRFRILSNGYNIQLRYKRKSAKSEIVLYSPDYS